MVRAVYNQSPGNPVQSHLLPSQPLEMEVAFRSTTEEQENKFIWTIAKELYVASFIGLLASWIPFLTKDWPNFAFAFACFVCFNMWRRKTAEHHSLHNLHLPMVVLVWLYHALSHSFRFEVFFALVANVLLAREVVRHFTFVSTVAPLSLQASWSIRNAMDKWTLLSVVPLLLIAIAVVRPDLASAALAAALVTWLSLAAWFSNTTQQHLCSYVDSLRSWCCYNHDDLNVPGTLRSPAGKHSWRLAACGVTVFVNSIVLGRYAAVWLDHQLIQEVDLLFFASQPMEWILQICSFALRLLTYGLLPPLIILMAVFITGSPLFGRLSIEQNLPRTADHWKEITDRVRSSKNVDEAASLYIGRIAHDQSPLLVPRSVFAEHAHFLGDSGSGKTARGLSPFVEQILSRGDASVMILDLKGDSNELFQAASEGAKAFVARSTGPVRELPIKYLSTREDEATFGFNPLASKLWASFTAIQRTDILCGALGLNYGSDYGEGYFSSANSAVLLAVMQAFPESRSFDELAKAISQVVKNPKHYGLDDKSRDAGNHLRMLVVRLAQTKALNVHELSCPSEQAWQMQIEPAELFSAPQLHYYKLSAALGPGSSPEIARLAAFMLLSGSSVKGPRVPVYLVIDEFQRMATRNLDYLLQLARSMGVSVVLANQSIQDLKRYDLVNVLETNCRYKQWFAISSWEDQQRLVQASGETVDEAISFTTSEATSPKGTTTSSSVSRRELVAPRLTLNDVKLASDEDRKSIVLINRGAGYAQFGGMPLVVETDYHIDKIEYDDRKRRAWPADEQGTFLPANWDRPFEVFPHRGRKASSTEVSQETIDFDIATRPSRESRVDESPALAQTDRVGKRKRSSRSARGSAGPSTKSSTLSSFEALLERDPLGGPSGNAKEGAE